MASLGTKYNKSPLKGNDTYGLLGGTSTYTKYTGSNNTSSKSNTLVGPSTPKAVQPYTTTSSYSGGYSAPQVTAQSVYDANLEAYQKAYDAAVNAAKTANEQNIKSLSDAIARTREDIARDRDEYNKYYDNQASSLLKSIERFRESNAQDVADQKKAYLSNQAALESARAEADRQSRIEAAARGLGGSGLQQLAQLQNLINQSQDISNVANENQTNMDKLRLALSQAEDDYNERLTKSEDARKSDLDKLSTTLRRAEEDYTTNVNKENANLRDLLAQYEATRASNNVDALSNLYSRVSASGGSGGSGYSSDLSLIAGGLQADQQDFENALYGLNNMTKKELQSTYKTTDKSAIANSLYNEYLTKSNNYLRNYGNQYSNLTNISSSNLKNILNNYGY